MNKYVNLVLLLLLLFSGCVMAEGIFIHSYNEQSNRFAILDELDESAILYLSEIGSQKPEKDAFAYMRVEPLELSVWKDWMSNGKPPVLHFEIASKEAIITFSKELDFSFLWTVDGESVALLHNKIPIAFIYKNEKYGYSKAVSKSSPIVNVWNQDLYDKLFIKK
jgi:hypothetical protein